MTTAPQARLRRLLAGATGWLEDLSFDEAVAAVDALMTVSLPGREDDLLSALEANFPGIDLSDLIYWPDKWFEDPAMLEVELSAEDIVGYASEAAGRALIDAPIATWRGELVVTGAWNGIRHQAAVRRGPEELAAGT